jgi:hypothetical protein
VSCSRDAMFPERCACTDCSWQQAGARR